MITCEAFKDAIRQYGGKEKLLEEIYNLIKKTVLYKEEKQNVNKPFTYDRFLQSYSFGTISERIDKNGIVLHSSNVPFGRCGQGDAFRLASVHQRIPDRRF